MRLLLLVLFAFLSAYLVNQINGLVNNEGAPTGATATDSTQSASAVSKSPDREVLSIFDELIIQDVTLDSNFESSRDNPF